MKGINPSIKTEIIPLIIIALAIAFSFYFYAVWPDVIASHWNFKGEVDGYSPKDFIVWMFHFSMAFMYALFLALPYIDPKKRNYEDFSGFYHFFKAFILTIFFALYMIIGGYNMGYYINVALASTFLIGSLMIFIGLFLKKIKPNWFVGIKTPWTLSSDKSWKKTHELTGKLFMIFGILIIISNFLPELLASILMALSVLSIIIISTVYSYLIYNSDKNAKKR